MIEWPRIRARLDVPADGYPDVITCFALIDIVGDPVPLVTLTLLAAPTLRRS